MKNDSDLSQINHGTKLIKMRCNCADKAPTMPVYRDYHFDDCPISLFDPHLPARLIARWEYLMKCLETDRKDREQYPDLVKQLEDPIYEIERKLDICAFGWHERMKKTFKRLSASRKTKQ